MMRIAKGCLDLLGEHIDFCLENIRHPRCALADAGRFYEEAADHLRAHAILRLLIDVDADGFSSDLVMSGQARRAWLRRCAREGYSDYFLALSRSGSMLDAVAAGALELATEIFRLSPSDWRKGDEYEEDFCYQRFLGLHLTGAPPAVQKEALGRLERAAEDDGARLAICRALHRGDQGAFEDAFQTLLLRRAEEIADEEGFAEEDLTVAAGAKVFIEGIAVLKLARRAGLAVAFEYPSCPALALVLCRLAQIAAK